MNANFKIGFGRANLIVVSLVMCMIFSVAAAAQNNANKVLDEDAADDLVGELSDGLFVLGPSGSEATAITRMWVARGSLGGKTRAQILVLLFADVQAVVKDPAMRTKVWKAWNPPAAPAATPVPIWNDASHPMPQAAAGYITVVSDGTMRLALLKWDVTIVDEQKRPVAGAKVSIKLKYGYAGASGALIRSINGRPVTEGIILTATTNSTGTCSLSIPWTQNVNYDLSVSNAQGQPLKFRFEGKQPYDGPLPKDFNWEAKWKPSETIEMYSPETLAKITKPVDDARKTNADTIAAFLRIPDDKWTRADGWDPSLAAAAVEANNILTNTNVDGPYNALTEHEKVRLGLSLMKLALSPNSFAALKNLYDKVRTYPRVTEPATFTFLGYATKEEARTFHTFEGVIISRSARIPFKDVPDPEDYKLCAKAADERSSPPDDCQGILHAHTPYQARWERTIYTSCLDDPNLKPVADEMAALFRAQMIMPGPLWQGGSPSDARDNICSTLVKNEMAKDMARDGFGVELVNAGLQAGTAEYRPPLRTVNIGGVTERVTDQPGLIKWFGDRGKLAGAGAVYIGERKQQGESDQALQARVLAMLREGVEPVSGRRLDDSLIVYRVQRYQSPEPNTISLPVSSFGAGTQGHLFKNYLENEEFNKGKRDEPYFIGRVPPGRPMPDRRDVAIAIYGWPVGATSYVEMITPKDLTYYFGFVMKRWVMFNLRTGEIYGTSKVDGKLFP